MLTEVGKFLRKLRIDRDEILMDMANKLGVTASYLSAIENGKREFPEDWEARIDDLYDFEEAQKELFKKAIVESKKEYNLSLEKVNKPNRELAYVFARKFKDLDEKTVNTIKDLLEDIEYDTPIDENN